MLKPKVIANVLSQTTNNGIKASIIMTSEGSLISFAADNDKDASTYSAICANIWNTYKKMNTGAYKKLQSQLVYCENGVVLVTCVGNMLLCLVALPSTDLGILKAKAEAIKSHLKEPLTQIATSEGYPL
ncbi:hypothetical protein BDF20DRAFT_827556 [Mycotypha africana]|uniref:uncharacterized protein n=1 Tax=Mycotypha africana TaxID=64632 RepID=UPI002300AE24|nr:uncharacterized protein BDF20DRAFT_827556 [Mycotypha africana]KAI8969134.1 hypothetical protein BDF20DRAFT_827556 [Mycotypha africana]